MKIKTKIRAGGMSLNHNSKHLVVKSGTKAGGVKLNHNSKRLKA